MIQLLQIISHMFSRGYSQFEIDCAFTDILNGDEDIETLLDFIGVEITDNQMSYLKPKLSLYESALNVTALKLGVS